MTTVTVKLSKLSDFGLFGVICLAAVACADNKPNLTQQVDAPQISAIESALENPVAKCQEDQATCVRAAADGAAALKCNESYRTCLGGAAEQGQQLAQTLEQCRETATQCAVQGGAMGAEACRSDYESCVSAATDSDSAPPAAGSGGSGEGPGLPQRPRLPQLPAAGSIAPRLPGGPGLPGRLPFAGAGGIGGLPTLPRRPGFPNAGSISLPGAAGRGGLPGRLP